MLVACAGGNRQAGKREGTLHVTPSIASKIPIVTEYKRILPTQ